MAQTEDQQFCLRWNNFQANITSQFETLREDEDFTDVTIACEGRRLQAHKVVLSACSPFFKELFKANPCSHPIIFMRDVEAQHIVALMEFMYAGEVNVAQAHLPSFLKTAESLKIRGLTDTDSAINKKHQESAKQTLISSSSTVTSSQDISDNNDNTDPSSPPSKKLCKSEQDSSKCRKQGKGDASLQPKSEMPEYSSEGEEEGLEEQEADGFRDMYGVGEATDFTGSLDYFSQQTGYNKDLKLESPGQGNDVRKLHSLDPRPCDECGKVYSNLSNLRQHMRLIHFPTYVQCAICRKPFKTDLYLRRHMLSSHGIVNASFPPVKAELKSYNAGKFYDLPPRNGLRPKFVNPK